MKRVLGIGPGGGGGVLVTLRQVIGISLGHVNDTVSEVLMDPPVACADTSGVKSIPS